jgi:Flp pilus assembly protein TadB
MNSFLAVLYAVAFLANAAAAIFWGVREKRAREELLRAKEAQIDLLREFTSTKVMEHFRDTKAILEDSIRAKKSRSIAAGRSYFKKSADRAIGGDEGISAS